ncbi:hypothetical protein ACJX0J_000042 (mitochondrion) [Zea mays]
MDDFPIETQKKREQATSLLKEELGTGRISKILLKRIAHLRKFQSKIDFFFSSPVENRLEGTGIWELEEVVLISFFPYLIDAFLLKEEGKGVSMQILHPGIQMGFAALFLLILSDAMQVLFSLLAMGAGDKQKEGSANGTLSDSTYVVFLLILISQWHLGKLLTLAVIYILVYCLNYQMAPYVTVARSSTEAEYRAIASTAAEVNWIMNLLQELKSSIIKLLLRVNWFSGLLNNILMLSGYREEEWNSKFIMQSNRDLFNLGNMYPVTFSLFIYKGTFNGISLMAKIFLFIVVKPVTLQPGLDGDYNNLHRSGTSIHVPMPIPILSNFANFPFSTRILFVLETRLPIPSFPESPLTEEIEAREYRELAFGFLSKLTSRITGKFILETRRGNRVVAASEERPYRKAFIDRRSGMKETLLKVYKKGTVQSFSLAIQGLLALLLIKISIAGLNATRSYVSTYCLFAFAR